MVTANALLLLQAVHSAASPVAAPPSCDSLLASRSQFSASAAAAVQRGLGFHRGAVVRWPDQRAGAIRVWTQAARAGPGLAAPSAAEWTVAVRRAARGWSGAAPGVSLVPSADSARADVRVVWAAPPHRGSTDASAAQTALVVDTARGAILAADIRLARQRAGAPPLAPLDVQALAAHELGHALGLTHQTAASSVMAPRVAADGASPDDRALLRAWYALPVGLRCAQPPRPVSGRVAGTPATATNR